MSESTETQKPITSVNESPVTDEQVKETKTPTDITKSDVESYKIQKERSPIENISEEKNFAKQENIPNDKTTDEEEQLRIKLSKEDSGDDADTRMKKLIAKKLEEEKAAREIEKERKEKEKRDQLEAHRLQREKYFREKNAKNKNEDQNSIEDLNGENSKSFMNTKENENNQLNSLSHENINESSMLKNVNEQANDQEVYDEEKDNVDEIDKDFTNKKIKSHFSPSQNEKDSKSNHIENLKDEYFDLLRKQTREYVLTLNNGEERDEELARLIPQSEIEILEIEEVKQTSKWCWVIIGAIVFSIIFVVALRRFF